MTYELYNYQKGYFLEATSLYCQLAEMPGDACEKGIHLRKAEPRKFANLQDELLKTVYIHEPSL